MSPRRVAVIGGVRIPFARSMGKYMGHSNQDLMTFVLQTLVNKFNLRDEVLGDVALGAVLKHSADFNLARECTMGSGLSAMTPAYDVQQACGTSLEAAILVGNKIALGQIDAGIAGGTDTNSDLPIVFSRKFSHRLVRSVSGRSTMAKLKPWMSLNPKELFPVAPGVLEPRTKMSMGQSCEVMAKQWGITREEQDELAFRSHQNGAKAYEEGFFNDLIVPYNNVTMDNNLRGDTSVEKLSSLKPAFDRKSGKGTLTAGNSTPLTDGASAVLLASEEWAKAKGLPITAYLTFAQTAAVDYVNDEGLLMAPAYAVPKLLKQAGMKLQDFDYYEIHEAFAAQTLCTLKAWESADFCRNKLGLDAPLGSIDRSKLNVKGGSVALGHPFAATGTRIVATLAKLLKGQPGKKGLISICTAGGMGVTAIMEGA
ncbi:MAG: acetyl-CoA C-acetyltransferase [Bdellovibrionaceae bacterium]|nr:acetyl-CoA C-acetyltransferase [Pseudobdellovibrionaceae bacterium]